MLFLKDEIEAELVPLLEPHFMPFLLCGQMSSNAIAISGRIGSSRYWPVISAWASLP
jgi:hypothetical protein